MHRGNVQLFDEMDPAAQGDYLERTVERTRRQWQLPEPEREEPRDARRDPLLIPVRDIYTLQVDLAQYCVLCFRWSDPMHRRSRRHLGNIQMLQEMDPEQQRQYLQERRDQARAHPTVEAWMPRRGGYMPVQRPATWWSMDASDEKMTCSLCETIQKEQYVISEPNVVPALITDKAGGETADKDGPGATETHVQIDWSDCDQCSFDVPLGLGFCPGRSCPKVNLDMSKAIQLKARSAQQCRGGMPALGSDATLEDAACGAPAHSSGTERQRGLDVDALLSALGGEESSSSDARDPASPTRSIRIQASKWYCDLFACAHSTMHEIHLDIATRMRVPTWKVMCISQGRILPSQGRFANVLYSEGNQWLVTTYPIAGDPAKFEIKSPVNVKLEDIWQVCCVCRTPAGNRQATLDSVVDDDIPDDDLREGLEQALADHSQREQEAMEGEDKNVLTCGLKRSRDHSVIQVYEPMSVRQLVEVLAKKKRVKKDLIGVYAKVDSDDYLQQSGEYFLHVDSKRGGMKPVIKILDQIEGVQEVEIEGDILVDEFLQIRGSLPCALYAQHGRIAYSAPILDYLDFFLVLDEYDPLVPVVRSKQFIFAEGWISLAELSMWYPQHVQGLDDWSAPGRERHLLAARLAADNEWRQWNFYKGRSNRGGAPKDTTPWESTRSIRGVQLVTDVVADAQTLKVLCLDEVVDNISGVTLAVLSSWGRLANIKTDKALIAVFPGRCAALLRKLGAAETRVVETELIVANPDTKQPRKKMITYFSFTDAKIELGKALTTVQWAPQADLELQQNLMRDGHRHYSSREPSMNGCRWLRRSCRQWHKRS